MNTMELTANDLNEALFATNGDAMLIETKENAKYVKFFIKDKSIVAVYPGEPGFTEVCARLELTESNHPKKVFKLVDCNNTEVGYIAFPEDWDAA